MNQSKIECYQLITHINKKWVKMDLSKIIYMKFKQLLDLDIAIKISFGENCVYLAVGEALEALKKDSKNAHSLIKILDAERTKLYQSEIDVKDFINWDFQKLKLMKTILFEIPDIQDLQYEVDPEFNMNELANFKRKKHAEW